MLFILSITGKIIVIKDKKMKYAYFIGISGMLTRDGMKMLIAFFIFDNSQEFERVMLT